MKTRIIVWAVVGLEVVLAAVMIVSTSGKRPLVRKTIDDFKVQVERAARQLDRMDLRVNALRAGVQVNPALGQKLDEVSRQLAENGITFVGRMVSSL